MFFARAAFDLAVYGFRDGDHDDLLRSSLSLFLLGGGVLVIQLALRRRIVV